MSFLFHIVISTLKFKTSLRLITHNIINYHFVELQTHWALLVYCLIMFYISWVSYVFSHINSFSEKQLHLQNKCNGLQYLSLEESKVKVLGLNIT